MAVPFDPDEARIAGEPRLVLEGVRAESQGSAQFAVPSDGTAVLARGSHSAAGRFHWVDLEGRAKALRFPEETVTKFQVSPEGRRLAAGFPLPSIEIVSSVRGRPYLNSS